MQIVLGFGSGSRLEQMRQGAYFVIVDEYSATSDVFVPSYDELELELAPKANAMCAGYKYGNYVLTL